MQKDWIAKNISQMQKTLVDSGLCSLVYMSCTGKGDWVNASTHSSNKYE